jgi:RNA polymerase sigma-70 factor, ECF subfamily
MASTLPLARDGAIVWGTAAAVDHDLAAGLRAGRRDSFERLYEAYRARIFNLALRIVQSYEDARDITQEVFIKAYRQLPGYEGEMSIKPWLYRVAVNSCNDHLRSRRVHRDSDEVERLTRAAPVDTFEQAQLSHQLEQTLAGLPDRHRTVLLLKDIHGLRHDEIADILGVSRGATETLLFRAREAFRHDYAELTREHPAGDCHLAREATVAAVGSELPTDVRRKIVDHARYCPECRTTVKSWGVAAVGLGLFLHSVPLPAALQAPLSFGAAGASAAGAGAAGASAAGAGAAGGGSAGLAAVGGGVAVKLSGVVAVKIAVIAVAATCAVSAAGVTAYKVNDSRQHRAARVGAVAAAQSSGGLGVAATTGASKVAGSKAQGQAAGRSTAPGQTRQTNAAAGSKSNGKGKPDDPGANANGGAAAGKTDKSNNGKATGRSGITKAKPAKPTKPVKPTKPAKPDKPGKPDKPDTTQ